MNPVSILDHIRFQPPSLGIRSSLLILALFAVSIFVARWDAIRDTRKSMVQDFRVQQERLVVAQRALMARKFAGTFADIEKLRENEATADARIKALQEELDGSPKDAGRIFTTVDMVKKMNAAGGR